MLVDQDMTGHSSGANNGRITNHSGPIDPVGVRTTGDAAIDVTADDMSLSTSPSTASPPKQGKKLDDYNKLTEAALTGVLEAGERVRAAFVNPDGATVVTDGTRRQLPSTVGMLVTDRRIAFVTPTGSDHVRGSLEYGDIARIQVTSRRETLVECHTLDGDVWRFVLPGSDPDVADAVGRHLRWIGEVRPRVVQFDQEVREQANEIRLLAAERNWDGAREFYHRARDRLDNLICAVQFTEPIADHVLAPELNEMERVLENARVTMFVERSRERLEQARPCMAEADYHTAQERLEGAHAAFRFARDHHDGFSRPDAFQFGPERELEEAIQRLEWRIETIAAEPLRQAIEAKIRAEFVDAPAKAVAEWETAYRLFDSLHSLGAIDTTPSIVGEFDKIVHHRETAGTTLYELHSKLGREAWMEAGDLDLEGNNEAALERYTDASEHLQRAQELATEFASGESDVEPGRQEREQRKEVEATIDTLSDGEADAAPWNESLEPDCQPGDSIEFEAVTGESHSLPHDVVASTDD